MKSDRKLDIAVAKLLDLDVLGQAPCYRSPETGEWSVSWYEHDSNDTLHMVYLAHCDCKLAEPEDVVRFGHVASCLEVVPFYHKDNARAIQALEQICDERKLIPQLLRWTTGEWRVRLVEKSGNLRVFHSCNKSLPLAICRALAELGEE